jgi:hypothetical protein
MIQFSDSPLKPARARGLDRCAFHFTRAHPIHRDQSENGTELQLPEAQGFAITGRLCEKMMNIRAPVALKHDGKPISSFGHTGEGPPCPGGLNPNIRIILSTSGRSLGRQAWSSFSGQITYSHGNPGTSKCSEHISLHPHWHSVPSPWMAASLLPVMRPQCQPPKARPLHSEIKPRPSQFTLSNPPAHRPGVQAGPLGKNSANVRSFNSQTSRQGPRDCPDPSQPRTDTSTSIAKRRSGSG